MFGPIVPSKLLTRLKDTFNPLDQPGLLALVFTVMLGFTLFNLNNFIYKIYEGYFILERMPVFKWWQRRRVRNLRNKIDNCLDRMSKAEEDSEDLNELEGEHYRLRSLREIYFPPTDLTVLPTGFGNILRAAEAYSGTRYGIDSVMMWPRLIHVIPEPYYSKLDQSNNGLAFLVNSSLLALALAISCFIAAGYQHWLLDLVITHQSPPLYFIDLIPNQEIYEQRINLYLGFGVLLVILSMLFYQASLPILAEYGSLIRSSFDLFRFDLLKQLKQKAPKDSEEELDTWRKISEFITIGDPERTLKFDYANAESGAKTGVRSGTVRKSPKKPKRSLSRGTRRSKR